MESQRKRSQAPARRRRASHREMEDVRSAANSYCLSHYAVGYTGGIPRRLSLRGSDVWIVPVVLTSPGYGVVGEVGVMAIDGDTQEVVGATTRAEIKAAGSCLAKENRDELDAAFAGSA